MSSTTAHVKVAPTGKLVQGTVFDVNKKHLEEKLKRFDPQLYLKWNPQKNYGYGMWELRIRPEYKTAVYHGDGIYELKYVEEPLVAHVVDMPVLTYRILDWLKDNDTRNTRNWVDDLEYKEQKEQEKIRNKASAELRYWARHEKSLIRSFKEHLASGVNPATLAKHWK